MRLPRITPHTPSCLLTTALSTSNSSYRAQCAAGGAVCYNGLLPSIRATKRWSSSRYIPPSSADRARAAAAAGPMSGRHIEGGSRPRGRGEEASSYRGSSGHRESSGDREAHYRGTSRYGETSSYRESFRHRDGGDSHGTRDGEGSRGKYTGPRKRLPNPAPPPRRKPATVLSETNTPQLSQEELKSVYSQELFVFRCDTSAALIPSAMSSYPNLRSLNILLPGDISNLARQLHSRFRHDKEAGDILPHIKLLIADLRSGAIPGHPLASVHIISCLKVMEEYTLINEFWEWLKQQSIEHCDARVYGAIIEALAFQGEPLPQLERLYEEAFDRYSNTSDISPLEARESGATRIMLLQGIITARILNGDWRAAYEAFDLILRLYPTATPQRVYELFIYERPVPEAFTVFLIACRAGTPPTPGVLVPLLNEVWKTHGDISAMLRLCWAYVGAGGELSIFHLNSVIQGLLLSYSGEPAAAEGATPTPEEKKAYRDGFTTVLDSIRALMNSFRSRGIAANVSTFNTLITCGGKIKRGDIVLGSLRDMLKLGIRPNNVTFRTLINAAAEFKDPTQLEEAWSMLVNARIEERDRNVEKAEAMGGIIGGAADQIKWDPKDWIALVSASLKLGKGDFAKAEIEKYKAQTLPRMYTWAWGIFNEASANEARRKNSNDVSEPTKQDETRSSLNSTSPLSKHRNAPKGPPCSFESTILELSRFLQALDSPAIIQFSPPKEELSNTSALHSSSTNSDTTTTTTHTKTQPAPSRLEYLHIDLDLTAPHYPSLPSPHLQSVYTSLLLTSTLPTKAQSPKYLGTLVTDSHNRSSTGYTLRELRFQNWVAINKLLFLAELHDRAVEANVRREITKQGSTPAPDVKHHLWKEDQIQERVRRVNAQATKELAKGEDVDVDVRTGRITRRNEKGREEVMKGVKEEEWQIRRILGGGGFAWGTIDEGKVVLPEMFDERLEIENSTEKNVEEVVEEAGKNQPEEEGKLLEKMVTERLIEKTAETDPNAVVEMLKVEQKSRGDTEFLDRAQGAGPIPDKVVEGPKEGEKERGKPTEKTGLLRKAKAKAKEEEKEKEKVEILTEKPFANTVEKKKLLNEITTAAKCLEVGGAKKVLESAAPEPPLDKPAKERIAVVEGSVKAEQSQIQKKLQRAEQLVTEKVGSALGPKSVKAQGEKEPQAEKKTARKVPEEAVNITAKKEVEVLSSEERAGEAEAEAEPLHTVKKSESAEGRLKEIVLTAPKEDNVAVEAKSLKPEKEHKVIDTPTKEKKTTTEKKSKKAEKATSDVLIRPEEIDKKSSKAANVPRSENKKPSSSVELGGKASESNEQIITQDEKFQETIAASVRTKETPATTEVTLKTPTKTPPTPTPLTPLKASNTLSTTTSPTLVSSPASSTLPAPEPATPVVASTSAFPNSQPGPVSTPQEAPVSELVATLQKTSVPSPSIASAHPITSKLEVVEPSAAKAAPGPPWPTVSVASTNPNSPTGGVSDVEKVERAETKDDKPTTSSTSKAPSKKKQKSGSKKPEVTEPGSVEAANAIASAQAAEISAVEAGEVEKIAIASAASTSPPEPIPSTNPNTSFVSPLLSGSHISETIVPPPKGPPPSPEQLQKAMEELSALSEAENELADVMAELFAITEEVSTSKPTVAVLGAQEKGTIITVKPLQEELTPLQLRPLNGKGVEDTLPTTSVPETLKPTIQAQLDTLRQSPGEEANPRSGIQEEDSYVSKQRIDKSEHGPAPWQEDHQTVQSGSIESPIESQQKTSSPELIQENSNPDGGASQTVTASTEGPASEGSDTEGSKATKSKKQSSKSSKASK